MTHEEEIADSFGITEPHDENCHGSYYLCRAHFIEKLAEAIRQHGGVCVIGHRVPGGTFSGSVDVMAGETLLFKRVPLSVCLGKLHQDAIEECLRAKRAKDFQGADEIKALLERIGVDTQKIIDDQLGPRR